MSIEDSDFHTFTALHLPNVRLPPIGQPPPPRPPRPEHARASSWSEPARRQLRPQLSSPRSARAVMAPSAVLEGADTTFDVPQGDPAHREPPMLDPPPSPVTRTSPRQWSWGRVLGVKRYKAFRSRKHSHGSSHTIGSSSATVSAPVAVSSAPTEGAASTVRRAGIGAFPFPDTSAPAAQASSGQATPMPSPKPLACPPFMRPPSNTFTAPRALTPIEGSSESSPMPASLTSDSLSSVPRPSQAPTPSQRREAARVASSPIAVARSQLRLRPKAPDFAYEQPHRKGHHHRVRFDSGPHDKPGSSVSGPQASGSASASSSESSGQRIAARTSRWASSSHEAERPPPSSLSLGELVAAGAREHSLGSASEYPPRGLASRFSAATSSGSLSEGSSHSRGRPTPEAVLERGRPKEPTSSIRPSGPSTFLLLPAGTPKHSLPEAVAELRRAELCRSAFALAAELSRDAELLSVTPSGQSITDRGARVTAEAAFKVYRELVAREEVLAPTALDQAAFVETLGMVEDLGGFVAVRGRPGSSPSSSPSKAKGGSRTLTPTKLKRGEKGRLTVELAHTAPMAELVAALVQAPAPGREHDEDEAARLARRTHRILAQGK
ncbi:hypothetical protein DMC30DRAFT_414683 [Rhodotorula diobovata]|uniref:Uncharacterized protein n=1 Tax=Rhodotorula diobovata TaxID=5288 RepID=A0A5C5G1H7_9BASI|nr:hypothetical protein DMC30DRAFT_414683 [Rhodotorula diobovata]